MHPINRFFGLFGIQISRSHARVTRAQRQRYEESYQTYRSKAHASNIAREPIFEAGNHPVSFKDYECAFTANHLATSDPTRVLDIGSYTHFLIGLSAHYSITSVDIRPRAPLSDNETVLVCDAKKLDIPDCSLDAVTSLSAIEHFGLGRYGDSIDVDADRTAFMEMIRVLKPGGLLIFSTTLTRSEPHIAFNAHRIYTHAQILDFCKDLQLVDETFICKEQARPCSLGEITSRPREWDVYCGCWKKI